MQSNAARELHLFRTSQENRAMVLQVDTGFFFEIDNLFEAILTKRERPTHDVIVLELAEDFERSEVLNAISELTEAGLIDVGSTPQLYTKPPVKEASGISETSVCADLFHITLHVSHACNIKCAYCFAHGGDYGGPPRLMRTDVARQAVRWALNESKPIKKCQIDFFGGEPMLNFGLIRNIVPYAREYSNRIGVHVSFGIATNGTLISEEILQFLNDEEIRIQVSVDGNATDHDRLRRSHDGDDTYNVVAENLKKMTVRLPDRVSVHATMTSYNLDRKSIANDLKQFGACNIEVAPVVAAPQKPYAFREEHLPAIKQRLFELSRYEIVRILEGSKERRFFDSYIERLMARAKSCYGCQGGKTFLAVDVEGDVYFCSSLADRPEFKMGDVFTGLDSAVQEEFRESFHVDSRTDCRRCWARNLCGGGCLFDARTATEDPIRPNPVSCEQIRYSYELAMEMCLEIQSADEKLLLERYNLKWVNQGDADR